MATKRTGLTPTTLSSVRAIAATFKGEWMIAEQGDTIRYGDVWVYVGDNPQSDTGKSVIVLEYSGPDTDEPGCELSFTGSYRYYKRGLASISAQEWDEEWDHAMTDDDSVPEVCIAHFQRYGTPGFTWPQTFKTEKALLKACGMPYQE